MALPLPKRLSIMVVSFKLKNWVCLPRDQARAVVPDLAEPITKIGFGQMVISGVLAPFVSIYACKRPRSLSENLTPLRSAFCRAVIPPVETFIFSTMPFNLKLSKLHQ